MAQNPEGPPDLEEMWRDFTRKLSSFFGVNKRGGGGSDPGNGFQPDARSAGMGVVAIALIVVVVWLFSGSFIVQEGQRAVVTTFGRYSHTVGAGWGWRWPYPIQANETVNFTQTTTVEIGAGAGSSTAGMTDSAMLTQDENIVDVRFSVQYNLKDARAYLYENNNPKLAVTQAAESAVREIVGNSRIDSVLYEQRAALTASLVKSIQQQLDALNAGILVVNVNIEAVNPPDPVQQAFSDALKAGVDREALKNEGQAYANRVIPAAQGDAARLRENALGYKARIVNAAQGDADRFKAVYAEYQKAPAVTRDRMYIDAMQEVYSNVTKVMVDTHNGTNLIQLPLDRLGQPPAAGTPAAAASPSDASAAAATVTVSPSDASANDARARDNARSRDRDTR
ncbi:MAG: FtsH protease activity modulator HflK [Burkholderiales bacterium]|nr:FtsH protease activity modulator HflK [Burkholderiales bacterium]